MTTEQILEALENRRAILKEQIALDKNCYNDACLSQHSRGRVKVSVSIELTLIKGGKHE